MGYRSDVKAVFYTATTKWPVLKLYIDENFPEELAGLLKPIDNGKLSGYVFHDNDVKWYPDYPEVKAFNAFVSNFLELADGDDHDWAYEFVRIGEENDDVEQTYSDKAEYVLNVVQYSEVNF